MSCWKVGASLVFFLPFAKLWVPAQFFSVVSSGDVEIKGQLRALIKDAISSLSKLLFRLPLGILLSHLRRQLTTYAASNFHHTQNRFKADSSFIDFYLAGVEDVALHLKSRSGVVYDISRNFWSRRLISGSVSVLIELLPFSAYLDLISDSFWLQVVTLFNPSLRIDCYTDDFQVKSTFIG